MKFDGPPRQVEPRTVEGLQDSVPSLPAQTRWTSTRCSSGPDGGIALALPTGQDLDATTVVRALGTWFGQPA
ncbi:hypothetical protein [Micromonospora zamorensis]|uniref:hypothetical protein n=1 Tax=Micromonospora zamorensis TaxID=709883 RepID=UPI0033B6B61E